MGFFDRFKAAPPATSIPALPLPERSALPDGYVEELERIVLGGVKDRRNELLGRARGKAGRSSYALKCAVKVAESAAAVPGVLEEETPGGGWATISEATKPELRLLENPNRFQSRAKFIHAAMLLYQTGGRLFIFVHRDRLGRPADLVIEGDRGVKILEGPEGERLYEVTRGREKTIYPSGDAIVWHYPDPIDPQAHSSPWAIAEEERAADAEAAQWQRESMALRVLPDLILQLAPGGGAPGAAEAIAKGLKARRSGEGRASLIVDHDVKIHNLNGDKTAEVDFIGSRRSFQEMISAIFGVPRPVLGLLENATLANLEASEVMFWTGTVIPYLRVLGEELEAFLRREYGGRYRVRPDVSEVPALRALITASASTAQAYHSIGVPVDVISDLLSIGIPRFDGSDQSFLPSSLMPAEDLLFGGGASFPSFGRAPSDEGGDV